MKLSLSEVYGLFGKKQAAKDVNISGVSVDTRTIKKNELFFAIKGKNFDGHDYCAKALKKGACAV